MGREEVVKLLFEGVDGFTHFFASLSISLLLYYFHSTTTTTAPSHSSIQ